MHPRILPCRPETEYYFHEGCHIIELSNGEHDPDLSVARARVEPGVTTARHALTGTTERYVILQGQGQVEIGDLPLQVLGPGDMVVIPPECPQRITNTGGDDLIFLALCTPRFRPEAYRDLAD